MSFGILATDTIQTDDFIFLSNYRYNTGQLFLIDILLQRCCNFTFFRITGFLTSRITYTPAHGEKQ